MPWEFDGTRACRQRWGPQPGRQPRRTGGPGSTGPGVVTDGIQAGLGALPRRHTLPSAAHLLLCLPACLQVLNIVAESVLEGHPKAEQKLKEVLGHTPRQVGRRRRPRPLRQPYASRSNWLSSELASGWTSAVQMIDRPACAPTQRRWLPGLCWACLWASSSLSSEAAGA